MTQHDAEQRLRRAETERDAARRANAANLGEVGILRTERDALRADVAEFAATLSAMLAWIQTFRINEPPPSMPAAWVTVMHKARKIVTTSVVATASDRPATPPEPMTKCLAVNSDGVACALEQDHEGDHRAFGRDARAWLNNPRRKP
jgi:hypothetical protein